MMRGDTPATGNGWIIDPVFTVGERIGRYQPPGIMDGIGAFASDDEGYIRILVNHELDRGKGYPYELANGLRLDGARVSYFDIHKSERSIKRAGLAFHTIHDRAGKPVSNASQLDFGGFRRLCSARGVREGSMGFLDDIFFTGEETDGGTQWAIDVDAYRMWAVPAMGVGAWENWTPVESGGDDTVALLGGDDRRASPLYLYLGRKGASSNGFLDRNGLMQGTLYCWKADDERMRTPADFNGLRSSASGSFMKLENHNPEMAGKRGYDSLGYATQDLLDKQVAAIGCFAFSRPEDLHNDPHQPRRAVFASTGKDSLFNGADRWGTIYRIDTDLAEKQPAARLTILHDADALDEPDNGIRNPDNLVWAADGFVYVQEDRSTAGFGDASGSEASVWRLDPDSLETVRIAEMNRLAVAPEGSTDAYPAELGNWESSGVLDITDLFQTIENETLLMGTVQAHSITDGEIGGDDRLVEGGQLFFMSNVPGGKPAQ